MTHKQRHGFGLGAIAVISAVGAAVSLGVTNGCDSAPTQPQSIQQANIVPPKLPNPCTQFPGQENMKCGELNLCVDVLSNSNYCGSCLLKCPDGQACSGGGCGGCPRNQQLCNNVCVNIFTDSAHCAFCDQAVCIAGTACID